MAGRKTHMQARGRLRRQQLLDAARLLLETHELDELSLGDVAAQAGVPKGSAYHFFDNISSVYAGLSAAMGQELLDDQLRLMDGPINSWMDVVGVAIDRGVNFFNTHKAARQLLLGPKSPPEIKRSDRNNDYEIGRSFQLNIGRYFQLPVFPDRDRIFYHAVEIADLMFCLSVSDDGIITPEMCEEAKKVACAYLGLYIPAFLPPKEEVEMTGEAGAIGGYTR
ncbi:MAG: TetR/AcrR family transcriptional regulator [Sphingomonadales bacterium]|nr:MAG: TetR/AcrR family transcriptional regulator [Sphingomonadales bacterium]